MALRGPAAMLWARPDVEVISVHSPHALASHVSAWRAYGHAATLHPPSPDGREASVTSLGDDGWLVKVRDTSTVMGGGPCSQTITRLLADGSTPTAFSGSQWYKPDDTTDLAGCFLFSEQIHGEPAFVAQAVWAWLARDPLPAGCVAAKASPDPVVFTSVAEALAWITTACARRWPTEAAQATLDFACELAVDRVVVTNPRQITVRVDDSPRRVRFQCRISADNATVRVVGMTDDLGHEYTMQLPGREILRVSPHRPRR